MKTIKNVKLSAEDCIDKINEIGILLDVEMDRGANSSHIPLSLCKDNCSDGLLRVYDTKKGITLDGTMKNVDLNELVLNEFSVLYCSTGESSLKASTVTYKVPIDKFDTIRTRISTIADIVSLVDDGRNYSYYIMKVSSNIKDIITITQFNSGKLLIQGKNWDIWNEICSEIERELNISTKEILVRYVSSGNEEVVGIVTNDLVSTAEKNLKKRMNRAFEFLYEHDKRLLVSSQAQFDAAIDFGSYMCYVAPTLLVVEGYLKKILVDIGLCTDAELLMLNSNNKPIFNFGKLFQNNTLVSAYKNRLTGNTIDKENALLQIYDKYQWVRSPFLHNAPPPINEINTFNDAESIFDDIISMMINTYTVLC